MEALCRWWMTGSLWHDVPDTMRWVSAPPDIVVGSRHHWLTQTWLTAWLVWHVTDWISDWLRIHHVRWVGGWVGGGDWIYLKWLAFWVATVMHSDLEMWCFFDNLVWTSPRHMFRHCKVWKVKFVEDCPKTLLCKSRVSELSIQILHRILAVYSAHWDGSRPPLIPPVTSNRPIVLCSDFMTWWCKGRLWWMTWERTTKPLCCVNQNN